MIKAITFDGDGTLWDFKKVMDHSLRIVLDHMRSRNGEKIPDHCDIDYLVKVRNEVFDAHSDEFLKLEEVRRLSFIETLSRLGIPDESYGTFLNELYLKHRFEDIELYDDVLPTLNSLKNNYKIGLISNGNGYPEKCGLPGIFETVTFSEDLGFAKPDSQIFQVAFEELGCDADQIIHVGDSFESDFIGANNAGAKGIWLNRDNKPVPENCERWVSDLRMISQYLS